MVELSASMLRSRPVVMLNMVLVLVLVGGVIGILNRPVAWRVCGGVTLVLMSVSVVHVSSSFSAAVEAGWLGWSCCEDILLLGMVVTSLPNKEKAGTGGVGEVEVGRRLTV